MATQSLSHRILHHIGPFAAYSICVIALTPFYERLSGPDTISYLSIAQHYLAGDWKETVNTNWSPMFSWLLIPLLALQTPGLMAGRIVCFLSGLLALYGVLLLGRGFGLRRDLLSLAMYTSAAMIAVFALLRTGPDLLEAAILLFYFLFIFDRNYPSSRWMGAACGFLGAAAFLTKGYALYFFLGHFTLMNTLHYLLGRKENLTAVIRNFALGIAVFVLLGGPWITLMSWKLGRFSAGTTGDFNYRLVGPDSQGYPQYLHLIPPSSEHAISMWEEPAASLLPAWNPLKSEREFRHQLKLIAANLRMLLRLWLYASPLSIVIPLLYVIIGPTPADGARYHWLLLVATMVFLPAGYLLVLVQDRYLWSIFLLLPLMAAAVFQRYLPKMKGRLLPISLAGCFVSSFLLTPARMLVAQRHGGEATFQLSARIRQQHALQGRLAACGNWNDSLLLAYYLRLPFYGDTECSAEEKAIARELNPSHSGYAPAPDPDQIASQLAANNIRYYLVWPNCKYVPPHVTESPEITGGRLPGVKIYRLPEKTERF